MSMDLHCLAYAMIFGNGHSLQEILPGRSGAGDGDVVAMGLSKKVAFAMAMYWPPDWSVEVAEPRAGEDGADCEWFVSRREDSDDPLNSRAAYLHFETGSEAGVRDLMAAIERHWEEREDSIELDGLTFFERCERKTLVWEEDCREAAAERARSDLEAAEMEKRRQFEASVEFGSDIHRALITLDDAREVHLEFQPDEGFDPWEREPSSPNSMRGRLYDPNLVLMSYVEQKRRGWRVAPDGFVFVIAEFGRRGAPGPHLSYGYLTELSDILLERIELQKTRDPKTPVRTIETREDTI